MLFWIAAAVAHASHGCGTGRFALMPHHIDHTLEAQLEAEVKGSDSQADGCNNCAPHSTHTRTRAATRALSNAHATLALTACPCVSSNAGAHAGWSPVWAAPGDLCDMQRHMADPTIRFHHCSEDGYATNYKLEDHVKLCLKKEEIGWLWNHGKHGSPVGHHCQNGEGEPHLGPEGLLVCSETLLIIPIK